jgi:ATP-dependent exoDNAse (exonuclease V) beta subunit
MANSKFPNQLIRASAGSGKTFQLTNRYLGIASAGQGGIEIEIRDIPHPDRIKAIVDEYRKM